jgi:hypothetical protein
MDQALKDSRILITEDKHFGQLVYARMQRTGGVIFIRFPARARRSLPVAVVELVRRRGESLIGNLPSSNQDVAYRSKAEEVNIWILGIFGRDRRRYLRWVYEAKKRFGLSLLSALAANGL